MNYMNISDKYGDEIEVTINDYRELNPTGNFDERHDGIYEDGEQIAELIETETDLIEMEAKKDTYSLTEIENHIPMTEDEIRDVYAELTADATNWDYSVVADVDHLRLYAERINLNIEDDFDAVWEATPSRYTDWTMVTPDYGYIVIAELVS